MKHKTAELEGALLDAAVAMADGYSPSLAAPKHFELRDAQSRWEHPACYLVEAHESFPRGGLTRWFYPSQHWSDGGPIIEREGITIERRAEPTRRDWRACMAIAARSGVGAGPWAGSTPLEAAMRAYVASKFGDEVELP